MSTKLGYIFVIFLFLGCEKENVMGNDYETTEDIVSVIEHGVKNDGSPIGSELNELVRRSYGKTLYFPAGVYNLTEPMVLPLDYTKSVNLKLDPSAYVKSDRQLEALLKIGFSDVSIVDRSHRRFSYVEGGVFDCYNADNGVVVNGLKQLVSLKNMSLVRGRDTHLRIYVTDDFLGTGSCDTKIDNITIQGMSSNEDIYGIYIDESCADVKISNTFIYSTKWAIVTKSPGHVINNVHILSKNTTGGTDIGEDNYRQTEGIRIDCGGFFVFNQIYYDTVDKGIVIVGNHGPTLVLDQNIYYSYLDNFGTAFIYRDNAFTTPLQLKISNAMITARNTGFKVFDINTAIVGYDVSNFYTFVNSAVHNPHLVSPYDLSLLQKVRNMSSDALIFTNLNHFDTDWHVVGALVVSPYRSKLRIDLSDNEAVELDMKFEGGALKVIDRKLIGSLNNATLEMGYVVRGDYCVLVFRPKTATNYYPVINDLLGNGSFMITPSKDRHYRLADYGITTEPTVFLD